MTHPRYDGVIRGVDEPAYPVSDGEEDPLRGVRHMLDRLYADDNAPDSERMELISQILLAGLDHQTPSREWH